MEEPLTAKIIITKPHRNTAAASTPTIRSIHSNSSTRQSNFVCSVSFFGVFWLISGFIAAIPF